MQPHPGGDLAYAQRHGGLGDAQLVDGDEFDHRTLAVGERVQGGQRATPGLLGVELLLQPVDVVAFQQPVGGDTAAEHVLTRAPPGFRGHHVACDAVQPGGLAP